MRAIDENLTVSLEDLDDCHIQAFKYVMSALNRIDLNLAIRDRSNSMKNCIQDVLSKWSGLEWIPKTRDGQAPFTIDAKYRCESKCSNIHIINFVICLNNREAIGTNFLKLEYGALNEIRKGSSSELRDSNVLGVLITFSRDLLNLGKWDLSYADSSEYSAAARRYYRLLLQSNILNLRIHN